MNTPPETASSTSFLTRGGAMGERIRNFTWAQTPLGTPDAWPQSLRSAMSICLGCGFPIAIYWGSELALLYNDAWSPIPADKHPWALGRPARDVWPEIWAEIAPLFAQVQATGEPVRRSDQLLPMRRRGFTEECYFDFTFSPIRDEAGAVGGIFNAAVETTSRVLAERRGRLLRDLAAGTVDATTPETTAMRAGEALGSDPHDLPFALLYFAESDGTCRLAAASGLPEGMDGTLTAADAWPLAQARSLAEGESLLVEKSAQRPLDIALPAGPWPEPITRAVIHAVPCAGAGTPAGLLVTGLSPRLAWDDEYRGFLAQVVRSVTTALDRARAWSAERERAERLAEIDRAKTAFFSNVSHEFRTPLTLLLGPLEEVLDQAGDALPAEGRALVTVAHRNGLRLLKLVNSLLDFSRIEAGRTRTHFQPTDLAAYTAELASSFRSAMEKAGLDFVVECPPLAEPVPLDREMWEKIVLNLLSNAFKFTLEGEVRVTVRALDEAVEMTVRDTGAGIPEAAKPHLFERFYRVQGAQGRTHEGSGIGLALVHELVKLHGGTVRVESEVGLGSAFIVTIPRGAALLLGEQGAPAGEGGAAAAYVAEALRWLPDGTDASDASDASDAASVAISPISPIPPISPTRPRVLLADDNTDMRDYIARLLAPDFEVTAVADGQAALEAALDERPDLVLTDVMMPRLDGFGLLRAMRGDPALESVPVILLSARAGEEARVEGLDAGADDYLTKPFHARELLARVSGTLRLARVRAEALAREAELRTERTEILEGMNLAFVALDPDFRIAYLNPEAGRMHGITPEKYLGLTHWEAFPGSVGTAIETNYRRAMTERIPLHFENFYEPWQQWFEINAYPMTGGQLGVFFREITESKRLEEELRRSEALYRAIGESIDYGVWVCAPDGRNTYASQSFLKLLGITQEQCSDFGWGDTLHPDDAASTIAAWKECVRTGGKWDREHRFRAADGQWHSVLARGVPVKDERGEILCWAGINLDITDRQHGEQALREAKEKAEFASQSKDRFLAMLSHELRTPLTPVLMTISALQHDPDLAPDLREDLAMMKRNIELETRLIDDLLDVSRITSGKLPLEIAPLDLNEVVRHVCGICLQPLLDRSIRLEIKAADDIGLVAADPARLRQVLWNLLKNAIKFTPEGGAICVTTQRLADSRCEVRVEDRGMGISSELLPRIFDAFEQGDPGITRQFGGLGLGLAISKALVDLHGGSIRAESAGPGHGATFIIELPAAAPAALAPPVINAPVDTEKPSQIRLLVVEDHADTARTLGRILRRAGFAVTVVSDVASAAATAEREAFDVLVSDLGLPDGDGYEVMRRVRLHRQVPGIVMSGYGMDEDVHRSHEAGFTEHLVKPIDPTQLIAAIRRAAGRA